ncbi:MAG: septal ring lytic transglycosylase RlpA family protein [Desulfobulbaceae bacterium]|nr:septal ring lytic transglycosylase RlpA family protein [Desulfobulbaceae bacterium]
MKKILSGITPKPPAIWAFINICILAVILTSFLFLQGCARYKPDEPRPELTGYTETGIASYYALKFQFRRTASGERLNNLAMTAAHKTLPFGTKVLVTNLKNGKSTIVTINDRGPFIKSRIIDLTRTAFSQIENLNKGTVKVKIEVIK